MSQFLGICGVKLTWILININHANPDLLEFCCLFVYLLDNFRGLDRDKHYTYSTFTCIRIYSVIRGPGLLPVIIRIRIASRGIN